MPLFVSRNLNQFPDGSASAPGITFQSTPNTGLYLSGGYIYFSISGAQRGYLSNSGFGATAFFPNTSTSLSLQGRIADGASAIGTKIICLYSLTTTGAKIVSYFSDNGTTEASYLTKDGYRGWIAGNTQATVGAAGGASALPATPTGYAKIDVNGTTYVIPYYAQS